VLQRQEAELARGAGIGFFVTVLNGQAAAEKSGWFSRAPALLSGGLTVSGGRVY
jgi:hypothetical protein